MSMPFGYWSKDTDLVLLLLLPIFMELTFRTSSASHDWLQETILQLPELRQHKLRLYQFHHSRVGPRLCPAMASWRSENHRVDWGNPPVTAGNRGLPGRNKESHEEGLWVCRLEGGLIQIKAEFLCFDRERGWCLVFAGVVAKSKRISRYGWRGIYSDALCFLVYSANSGEARVLQCEETSGYKRLAPTSRTQGVFFNVTLL